MVVAGKSSPGFSPQTLPHQQTNNVTNLKNIKQKTATMCVFNTHINNGTVLELFALVKIQTYTF